MDRLVKVTVSRGSIDAYVDWVT